MKATQAKAITGQLVGDEHGIAGRDELEKVGHVRSGKTHTAMGDSQTQLRLLVGTVQVDEPFQGIPPGPTVPALL